MANGRQVAGVIYQAQGIKKGRISALF